MTPYERTLIDWELRPRDRTLAEYEELHKRVGFVFSTPAFYVMGRPVIKSAPIAQILDPAHTFDYALCDTWFIFQLTGKQHQAWKIMPWELPWMAWIRAGHPEDDVRFYPTSRLKELTARL